jgi:hypothetical protein
VDLYVVADVAVAAADVAVFGSCPAGWVDRTDEDAASVLDGFDAHVGRIAPPGRLGSGDLRVAAAGDGAISPLTPRISSVCRTSRARAIGVVLRGRFAAEGDGGKVGNVCHLA